MLATQTGDYASEAVVTDKNGEVVLRLWSYVAIVKV
jgi:hypothetical protein